MTHEIVNIRMKVDLEADVGIQHLRDAALGIEGWLRLVGLPLYIEECDIEFNPAAGCIHVK